MQSTEPSKRPSLDAVEPSSRVRKLGLWVTIICLVPAIVLIPITFYPNVARFEPTSVFTVPKFLVLLALLAPLLIAVLLSVMLSDKRRLGVPVLVPALAFLGVAILSTFFSGQITRSLVGDRGDGLFYLIGGVSLFYATARFLDSWARVRLFLAALVGAAVLVSVYGILQHLRLDPLAGWVSGWPAGRMGYSGGRAFSTLGGPVVLAAYLTLAMGSALALYFTVEGRWKRRLCLVALALVGACWLYTYTRGAMLGVGVALPVVLWFAYRRLGSLRPLLLPLTVLAAAMLAAHLLSPQSLDLIERFGNAGIERKTAEEKETPTQPKEEPSKAKAARDEGGGGRGDVSVELRLLMWRDSIPMILDRPLLGHGPSNLRGHFERYQGEDLQALYPEARTIDKTHNEFLQVAATTGLLGLAAYLWIFVAYFRNAYRYGGWVLLALSAGVLAYILQLQAAFSTMSSGIIFWAMLGVSVAVMRIRDRENADAPKDQEQ